MHAAACTALEPRLQLTKVGRRRERTNWTPGEAEGDGVQTDLYIMHRPCQQFTWDYFLSTSGLCHPGRSKAARTREGRHWNQAADISRPWKAKTRAHRQN